MPDPLTLVAAMTLGAIGTMAAAAKDRADHESDEDVPSSSYDEPCDWSYDDDYGGPSSSDHQTTLSDFD